MAWIITKYALTAAIIVLISEIAKRTEKIGALIGALPMVAVLAMVWMYLEHQPADRIASYAAYTFWYVLPTLPMFLAFPQLLPRIGFWGALLSSAVITLTCYVLLALVVRRFGIELL